MKNILISNGKRLIAIGLLLLFQFNIKAQCPDYIHCDGSNIIDLVWNQNVKQEMEQFFFQNFQLSTSENSPFNESYWVHNVYYFPILGITVVELYAEGSSPCQSSEIIPFISITFPDGSICNYEANFFCPQCPSPGETNYECEEFIDVCENELQTIISRNLTLDGCEQWAGDCGPYEEIWRYGGVGIGVNTEPPAGSWNSPASFKLFVQNGILTEQFKLASPDSYPEWGTANPDEKAIEWCDYVFEEDYPLMSLVEVERFIKEKKHLPNTPSAAEIEQQGGFEMRDVILNHQEKIEEIFLHLIELQEQVNQMKIESNKK